MKKKFPKCCPIGTHNHTSPMPIGGRSVDVDACLADLVAALNAANIPTNACCCGHGRFIGSILLADGRALEVYPTAKAQETHRKKHKFPNRKGR